MFAATNSVNFFEWGNHWLVSRTLSPARNANTQYISN